MRDSRAESGVWAENAGSEFVRLWEFYLCYCEGGFMERTIGTAQLLLAKPAAINPPLLGRFDA